jgi:hypothetical protein
MRPNSTYDCFPSYFVRPPSFTLPVDLRAKKCRQSNLIKFDLLCNLFERNFWPFVRNRSGLLTLIVCTDHEIAHDESTSKKGEESGMV